jgi:hypothetical protein
MGGTSVLASWTRNASENKSEKMQQKLSACIHASVRRIPNGRRVLKKCSSGGKLARSSTRDMLAWHFRADTKQMCGTVGTVS